MNEIRKLWESVKNILHHGPSTQPLWQSLIEKLQDHETRIAALEGHPALSIPPLQPETAPAPAPAVEPIIAPTETLHFPAAESANDSSTAGDKAASPSAQLEPGA